MKTEWVSGNERDGWWMLNEDGDEDSVVFGIITFSKITTFIDCNCLMKSFHFVCFSGMKYVFFA